MRILINVIVIIVNYLKNITKYKIYCYFKNNNKN